MLSAKNFTKKIAQKIVLNDVSVTIKPQSIVSVIGPSGAGKSSLLKTLALLDHPDQGQLSLDEDTFTFPLAHKQIISPYPKLTVVFQQLFMWPHLTIKQNLTLPLRGKIDHHYFDYITTLFDMTPYLNRYPNQVSGGERQRAALCRALLLKPRYLLLDEVTSALDIEHSHLIITHLKQVAAQGVGILIVSHAIHMVAKISDHLIFMEKGEIIEEGSRDLLKNPQTDRLKRFMNIEKDLF
jgi:ABC-type polar amino acid transport system ATPase subunit